MSSDESIFNSSTVADQLTNAITNGYINELQVILDTNRRAANMYLNKTKQTPLHLAAADPNHQQAFDVIEILLKYDVNVNTRDSYGCNALFYAATVGNIHVIERLINVGASIASKWEIDFWSISTSKKSENWGRTALHQAVRYEHVETVRVLIEHGADVNAQDSNGYTPLLLAGYSLLESKSSSKAYEQIVGLLLEGGAKVNIQNNNTKITALHNAIALKNLSVVSNLLRYGGEMLPAVNGNTPLHDAASTRWFEALRMLIEKTDPMMIDYRDKFGRTALHCAAMSGCRKCIIILLEAGTNVALKSDSGLSGIDIIFSQIPKPVVFLYKILDKHVTCNHPNVDELDFRLELDFGVFIPRGCPLQMTVIDAFLKTANSGQRLNLLEHPLIEAFLRLKWNRIRLYFFTAMIAQLICAINFSIYCTLIVNHGKQQTLLKICIVIFWIMGILSGLSSLLQAITAFRYWLREIENYLQLYNAVVILVLANCTPISEQELPDWILHLSSITSLCVWIRLMIMIGHVPTFEYYALMLSLVFQNVLKILMTYICLVLGLSFSLALAFYRFNDFDTFYKSLTRVAVMLMGEFEFTRMFAEHNADKRLTVSSTLVFILFIGLGNVIFMNVLFGLAISNIQTLQKESVVRCNEKQAEFIEQMEVLASTKIFNRWKCKNHPIFIRDISVPQTVTLQMGSSTTQYQNDLPEPMKDTLLDIALNNISVQTDLDDFGDEDDHITASQFKSLKVLLTDLKEDLKHMLVAEEYLEN